MNWAFNGVKFNAEGLGYFGIGALAGALGAGVNSILPVTGATQAMDPAQGAYKIIGANSMRAVIRIYP
jgi:hypothetical protein